MNIGFDFDKIFIDYPPFVPDSLVDWLFKDNSKKELTYRFPGKIEQNLRKISHLRPFRPPIIENIIFIQKLTKEKKHKLYLVSGRFSFLKDITHHLLTRYEFKNMFDEIFFNFSDEQPHLFKDRVIKNLKLDIYIDDDLPLLLFIQKNNSKTKLFWLSKKNALPENNKIKRITKLSDLEKKLEL